MNQFHSYMVEDPVYVIFMFDLYHNIDITIIYLLLISGLNYYSQPHY